MLLFGTFWGKRVHSNLIFTQNLKFIYADASAASAEFLISVRAVLADNDLVNRYNMIIIVQEILSRIIISDGTKTITIPLT